MSNPDLILRPFILEEASAHEKLQVNKLGLAAFAQYSEFYSPWVDFEAKIAEMSEMTMDITLAELKGEICGAIGLVRPPQADTSHFPLDWAVIRMLVVDPKQRGKGIGRALTEEVVTQAKTLGCKCIALHTSPIMEVALSLYLRMGFEKFGVIPDIYGVKYGLYSLELD
ncbi:MAG: GNAT family N-acetyltransferase [SAR324 cluster bacterium]|nr:GNAT family N-acetyltransferase [SAR324 cluster bacterium]